MKKLHLVCNAHLDPVWQWEWEEGASAAISTFMSAVELSDDFDYIFCHNEAILYKWIKEYAPPLYQKIKVLVKSGKWHIMGGWYLQPDCNMPSGESFVRQIMEGRKFFMQEFGVYPTTAINFDSFGHSVGLVQIIKKCGYDSYLTCRPMPNESDIIDDFIWQGLDGSQIKMTRISTFYNSAMGKVADKIKTVLDIKKDKDVEVMLWGVGNHGGGPSRKDLADIKNLMQSQDVQIIHSTPENYFAESANHNTVVNKSLNPCNPGCYTSQIRIKQMHRKLENEYYSTEKLVTHAAMENLLEYPHQQLQQALYDLLTAQFHDILPGSSVKNAEDAAIRMMEHGLEILNKLRAKAFFAFAASQKKARVGEFPILVYNPHPYTISANVEVEFMLEDQNHTGSFFDIAAYDGEQQLKTQVIKENSNMNLDWRKRIIFKTDLKPMSINRFDCKKTELPKKPVINLDICKTNIFNGKDYAITINSKSGYIESLVYNSTQLLSEPSFIPYVYDDNADPWGLNIKQLTRLATRQNPFVIMTDTESGEFSGLKTSLYPVRIIEDGSCMTSVECVFKYNHSQIIMRYKIYKDENYFDVDITVFFAEKDKMLKLVVSPNFCGKLLGQIAYGYEPLDVTGVECVCQKWCSIVDDNKAMSFINNGTYAVSMINNQLELSLLRSPAYTAYEEIPNQLTAQDRYTARIDQGERSFKFRVDLSSGKQCIKDLDYKAQIFNEQPYALNVFPIQTSDSVNQGIVCIDNKAITMTAFKKNDDGDYIIRLFNNNNQSVECAITVKNILQKLVFNSFEIITLKYDLKTLIKCDNIQI